MRDIKEQLSVLQNYRNALPSQRQRVPMAALFAARSITNEQTEIVVNFCEFDMPRSADDLGSLNAEGHKLVDALIEVLEDVLNEMEVEGLSEANMVALRSPLPEEDA